MYDARQHIRSRREGLAEAVRRVQLLRRYLYLSENRHGHQMPATGVSTQRANQRGGGMLQVLSRYVLTQKAIRGKRKYIGDLKFTIFLKINKISEISYSRYKILLFNSKELIVSLNLKSYKLYILITKTNIDIQLINLRMTHVISGLKD